MATEQDVLVAVETAAKTSGVAFLSALNAAGGAIDLQADVAAASLGAFGPEVAALAKPFIHQVLTTLIAKIA